MKFENEKNTATETWMVSNSLDGPNRIAFTIQERALELKTD